MVNSPNKNWSNFCFEFPLHQVTTHHRLATPFFQQFSMNLGLIKVCFPCLHLRNVCRGFSPQDSSNHGPWSCIYKAPHPLDQSCISSSLTKLNLEQIDQALNLLICYEVITMWLYFNPVKSKFNFFSSCRNVWMTLGIMPWIILIGHTTFYT